MKFVFIRCFLAFILMASACLAEDIAGTFKCNVIDVSLTTIEEGKVSKYSGYRNGMQKGHTFYFDYKYNPTLNSISLKGRSNEFRTRSGAYDVFVKRSDALKEDLSDTFGTKNNDIFFGPNDVSAKFLAANLNLNRYYKNDWQGLYVETPMNSILVAGLDCRHIKDKIDKIVSKLKTVGF